MNAQEIALKAAELLSGDRERTHGNKVVNFANIARLWNAWFENNGVVVDLDSAGVAELMALLKIARMSSGEYNADDAIDGCGYIAIAGELSMPVETLR